MSRLISGIGGALLVVLIVVVLVRADAGLFSEDAEFSSLYEATLDDAYSRFAASDRKVPARGPDDDLAGGVGPHVAAPPQAVAGRQAGAGLTRPPAAGGSRSLGFGKGQPLAGAQPGTAGIGPAQAHQHTHDDGGVHTQRGGQYLGQGQYDQAIAEFRLALQENPNRPLAQHYIGDALRYQGKHAEAIAAYEAVLVLKPSYHCCYLHMGEILAGQGRQQEAEAYFGKAITAYREELSAGGPQASVAAYHLAKFYVDNNRDSAEAIRLAEQAVAAAPTQAVYLHLLARCYEQAGQRDAALRTIDRVLQLRPPPSNIQVYQQYRNQLAGAAPALPPAAGGKSPG